MGGNVASRQYSYPYELRVVDGPLFPPDNDEYTGKWISEDGLYGPYDPTDFLDATFDDEDVYGRWYVWESRPTTFTVKFDANGGAGSMPDATFDVRTGMANVIPGCSFYWLGYRFLHWSTSPWDDSTGKSYDPSPAYLGPVYVYNASSPARGGDTVTFYAIWKNTERARPTASGEFVFTLQAGEQMTIKDLPAGAAYVVTEDPIPKGWSLVKTVNATGVIAPDV